MGRIKSRKTEALVKLGASVALVLLVFSGSKAYADPTSEEVQAEADAALSQLNTMQSELDKASNDYYAALDEQQQAEQQASEAQTRIDEATAEIDDLQGRLGHRARTMYRDGSSNFLDILLGATSFREFATSISLLNTMNENDADLVQQSKSLREEVSQKKAVFDEQSEKAKVKAAEAEKVKSEAESTVASMTETYNSLSSEAAALLESEQAAQTAAAAAAAEQAAAASTSDDSAGQSADAGVSSDDGSSYSEDSSAGGGSSSPSGSSSSSSSSSSYNSSVADIVVSTAYSKIGCPYVWGAAGPSSFDCSGLVQYCYAQAGVSVGHYTGSLIGLPQVSNPQPGDICVVHNSSSQHTGIYIGGGQMIHAPTFGQTVCVASVQSGMIYVRPNY